MNALEYLFQLMLNYAFYYPVTMSCFWIFGGLIYYWQWERHDEAQCRPVTRWRTARRRKNE